jgi:carboxypeptidase C (cathepsin A)
LVRDTESSGDPKDSTPTAAPVTAPSTAPEEPPVVTRHELQLGDRSLTYYATVGMLPIKNEAGEVEARCFYTAYTLGSPEGDRSRPLMISFNGGPGSASIWLHLGGLGPRRVQMLDDGAMPAPPFKLIDNEQSWLEATDLVFIDPVDTGYSRASSEELSKKFLGVRGDIESVGEFIRLYLSRAQRWSSPLFLVGESYGTFRAAGLAGHLIEQGIAFSGIVLVSSILNMQTARFDDGNDLPYALFLPSYAAIAWYHQRLPADLQAMELEDALAEVTAWAGSDYLVALARGRGLAGEERAAVVERLARYTGLTPRFIEQHDLRLTVQDFREELLRDEGRTVGRLDGRYTGFGMLSEPASHYDPSMSAIRPPFTAMLNDYIRGELGYETDAPYHVLRRLDWDWGSAAEGYSKTDGALAEAFAKNPYLRLFVASGYYDLATPYFATAYTLDHLPLAPEMRDAIRTEEYPVGHMVYLEKNILAQLQADVTAFIAEATAQAGKPLRG